MSADYRQQEEVEREMWEQWVCPYCGNAKTSPSGEGVDVACCGEIGHAQREENE